MNVRDRIITALTPGSAFNANGKVWRSLDTLAQFAGIPPEDTLELLAGDLGDVAVVRPSQGNKGLLAALKEHVPPPALKEPGEQVAIVGGPAFNAPVGIPLGVNAGIGFIPGVIKEDGDNNPPADDEPL